MAEIQQAAEQDQVRIPPHNLNAEKSVLGAMLLDMDAVLAAVQILRAEDFYYSANGKIYEAMVQLYNQGRPVDFVTLTDHLETFGVLEAVGGYEYVTEISTFVPSFANVGDYIAIVRERALLRRLIKAGSQIIEAGYDHTRSVPEILSMAEKLIFDISQSGHSREFIDIQTAITEVMDHIQELSENGEPITGLSTGFPSLNHKLSGLHPSELILVASRPAMGKTAFGLNIAQQVARFNENATVAIFELEMPYEQLTRLLSNVGALPMQQLITGQMDDFSKLYDASDRFKEAKIFIDDTPSISVMEMRSKCRRLKMQHGLSLVLIDYLQLISGSGGRTAESRQQEVSEITRGLKLMARELEVPVILLAQVSRSPERRENHRPMLSDLRESGAIEQDADIVMFLYREAYYASEKPDVDPATITNESEVIIAKNRNGSTGTIKLLWKGETVSFVESAMPGMQEPAY